MPPRPAPPNNPKITKLAPLKATLPPVTRSRSSSTTSEPPVKVVPSPSNEDEDTWIREVLSKDPSDSELTDLSSLARLMRYTLNVSLQTQQMLSRTQDDAHHIKHRVCVVEKEIREMDQYSRKDVAILTGLQYDKEAETEESLVSEVLGILKFVNPSLDLCYKDFSAIHRNGRSGKNGKPPSITIKFLRLHEKSKFFNKVAKEKFKRRSVNIFHALCRRMIDEQSLIKQHHDCDFIFYAGPIQHFSVKLKCEHFLNYVRDYADCMTKLSEHTCT